MLPSPSRRARGGRAAAVAAYSPDHVIVTVFPEAGPPGWPESFKLVESAQARRRAVNAPPPRRSGPCRGPLRTRPPRRTPRDPLGVSSLSRSAEAGRISGTRAPYVQVAIAREGRRRRGQDAVKVVPALLRNPARCQVVHLVQEFETLQPVGFEREAQLVSASRARGPLPARARAPRSSSPPRPPVCRRRLP